MDSRDYLTSIEANGGAILALAGRDLLAPTPQCPGWTVGHVVVHVGRAFRWMEELVRERMQARWVPTTNRATHDRLAPDLLPWFEDSLERFLATMRATDPHEPIWAWSGENRAGFWMRLQAHETAIHRTDAQSAFGSVDPVDPPLARDAIDGLLTWFVPRGRAMSMLPCTGKSLRFEERGTNHRWQIRIDDAEAELEPATEEPDVTVRGPISDVLLYLWQRTDVRNLEVEGERELAERWRELAPLP
jgi:uncharacterized protein (TIGR03083 family)